MKSRAGWSGLSVVAYTAMRVVLAFIYWCHGPQKVFGLFGGHAFPLTSQLGVAGVLETILGTAIAIGWMTPCVAFVASGQMAFAYFIGHASRGGLPIVNGGELAVVLCFAFLYIATRGAGPYSVDGLRGRG